MLKKEPGADVRVFVIWEPVLATDWVRPGDSITSNIPDGRTAQFWDHDRVLSAMLGGAANAGRQAASSEIRFRMKDVVWDTALLYPPGALWGAQAARMVAPVYKFADTLAITP